MTSAKLQKNRNLLLENLPSIFGSVALPRTRLLPTALLFRLLLAARNVFWLLSEFCGTPNMHRRMLYM